MCDLGKRRVGSSQTHSYLNFFLSYSCQELEDKHSEVERDIRILGNIPMEKKTAKDLEREEWLISELIAIVNERNKVVDAVEMDR